MNLFEKILGALHFNFLNRTNSPSQSNSVKMKNSHVEKMQQAGRDIYNGDAVSSTPTIEVLPESAVSDLARYTEINIIIAVNSADPLIILECFFDGVPTNHGAKKLSGRDVFHFDTINKERLVDECELPFVLKVRKQTGEQFLFTAKLKVRQFGNRYDLMVPGDETIERI